MIVDVFKYFAKFPEKSAVLKVFNAGASDLSEYAALIEEINTSQTHSLFPDIKDFIFDVSLEEIMEKLSNIEGLFMLIDYGDVVSSENHLKRKTDSFSLALTVAYYLGNNDYDNAERLILSDKAWNYLEDIGQVMREDSDPFIKRLQFPVSRSPEVSREFLGSVGWTMRFEMQL